MELKQFEKNNSHNICLFTVERVGHEGSHMGPVVREARAPLAIGVAPGGPGRRAARDVRYWETPSAVKGGGRWVTVRPEYPG